VKYWLALLAACSSSAPAATQDFFGPSVEPPRGLAKLQPGMKVDDAKRLVPGLHEPSRKTLREELVLDSGASDVTLEVRSDGGTVASIVAVVQGHTARETLTHAWGEPFIGRDSLGQPEVSWASEATGWKVRLDCLGANCLVEYVPYHVLTSAFFGAHVVPPGDLSELRIGMKLVDARKKTATVDAPSGIPSGVDGVREFVALDDRTSTIRAIYLNLPHDAATAIVEAWGDGLAATDAGGKTLRVWPDPTTLWRATLRDALGSSRDLAYDNYLPVAQLFGDTPELLDGLPEPLLDRAVDEVKKAYDAQTAGKDLVVMLPPTEWDHTATKLTLSIASGKVRELAFAIPFKAHPEARETLLDLFIHKWGAPKPREEDGKQILVFRDGEPHVEAREEGGAWHFEIK
jgi:hypothetical protein